MVEFNARVFFLIAAIAIVVYMGINNKPVIVVSERYQDTKSNKSESTESTAPAKPAKEVKVVPKEHRAAMKGAPVDDSSILNPSVEVNQMNTYPGPFEGCFPKQKELSPEDLLPKDMNSKWAQVNPAGQGMLMDRNFLDAGHHVGINTVGQSLRNANYNIRSEIPNPQVKVSPWMQSTIELILKSY